MVCTMKTADRGHHAGRLTTRLVDGAKIEEGSYESEVRREYLHKTLDYRSATRMWRQWGLHKPYLEHALCDFNDWYMDANKDEM